MVVAAKWFFVEEHLLLPMVFVLSFFLLLLPDLLFSHLNCIEINSLVLVNGGGDGTGAGAVLIDEPLVGISAFIEAKSILKPGITPSVRFFLSISLISLIF